jgi:hypothetical protein
VWGKRGTRGVGVCCVMGKVGQKKGGNKRHGQAGAGARGAVDALFTFLIGVEIYHNFIFLSIERKSVRHNIERNNYLLRKLVGKLCP